MEKLNRNIKTIIMNSKKLRDITSGGRFEGYKEDIKDIINERINDLIEGIDKDFDSLQDDILDKQQEG